MRLINGGAKDTTISKPIALLNNFNVVSKKTSILVYSINDFFLEIIELLVLIYFLIFNLYFFSILVY